MSILSTSLQTKNLQTNLGRLQRDIDQLVWQSGTGKKTDRFSGLGIGARKSLEFRSTLTTYSRYEVSISRTNLILQSQVNTLNALDDTLNDAIVDLTQELNGADPNFALINNTFEAYVREAIGLMNTQYDGRYIFGGRGTTGANVIAGEERPPVFGFFDDAAVPDAGVDNYFSLLSDPATGVTNVGIDAGAGPAVAGADRVMKRLDYIFDGSSPVPDGLPGGLAAADAATPNAGVPANSSSWYNGDINASGTGSVYMNVEVSQNVSVTYNSVIVDPASTTTSGFEDVLKGLSLFALLQPTGGAINETNQTDVIEVYNRGLALLKQGQEKLQTEVLKLGETQAFVARQEERNIEIQTFTEISLSEVEDVDPAKVATDLFQRQAQLEASYSIIGQLRNLRLSSYL